MAARIPDAALDHVIGLLNRDTAATLGESYEELVRDTAVGVRQVLEAGPDPDRASLLDHFFDQVVAKVQERIHDEFIHTSWPPCPTHPHHPLWLEDDHWTCNRDKVSHARLGELMMLSNAEQEPVRSVRPLELEAAFRRFAKINTFSPERDSHAAGMAIMLRFYAEVRVDGCDPSDDEDLLVVEWGSYDWGRGRAFEIDMIRQVILPGSGGNDIREFHLVYRFPNTPDLSATPASHDWWGTPSAVNDFHQALMSNAAFTATDKTRHSSVEIYFDKAG